MLTIKIVHCRKHWVICYRYIMTSGSTFWNIFKVFLIYSMSFIKCIQLQHYLHKVYWELSNNLSSLDFATCMLAFMMSSAVSISLRPSLGWLVRNSICALLACLSKPSKALSRDSAIASISEEKKKTLPFYIWDMMFPLRINQHMHKLHIHCFYGQ